jgi:hypothetical protein
MYKIRYCAKLDDFEKITGMVTLSVCAPSRVLSKLLQLPTHLTDVQFIHSSLCFQQTAVLVISLGLAMLVFNKTGGSFPYVKNLTLCKIFS